VQIAGIHAKLPRGLGPIPALGLQGLLDAPALAGLHRLAQAGGRRRHKRRRIGGGIGWRDNPIQIQQIGVERNDVLAAGAPAEQLQRGPADHMLQLAHVARPRVSA